MIKILVGLLAITLLVGSVYFIGWLISLFVGTTISNGVMSFIICWFVGCALYVLGDLILDS